MKRRLSLTLAVLVATLATIPLVAPAAKIDESIKQQQQKLQSVKAKLQSKRGELQTAKAKVGSLAEQLQTTNANIAAVRSHLRQIDGGLAVARRQMSAAQAELARAQADLERNNAVLRNRLTAAYEYGDVGYLAVLIEARSFTDFIDRWNDVRYVIAANEATIRARRAQAQRVLALQASLTAQETALASDEAAALQEQRALDGLALQRRNLLGVAENQRRAVQSQVAELDNMSEEAEAALENLVREKQHEEDARRAGERRAAQLAGESLPPEIGAPGQLIWPVSGPITSPFGIRMHPVYGRMIVHKGIDIAAASGTTIAAASDGRVIVASYQGDCGNMIAIDHHGGLSSIYCHLSQIFVSVGQDVQRGQAIGAVGMTGDATGPHLHFQVMQNDRAVDPMTFLR